MGTLAQVNICAYIALFYLNCSHIPNFSNFLQIYWTQTTWETSRLRDEVRPCEAKTRIVYTSTCCYQTMTCSLRTFPLVSLMVIIPRLHLSSMSTTWNCLRRRLVLRPSLQFLGMILIMFCDYFSLNGVLWLLCNILCMMFCYYSVTNSWCLSDNK